MNLSVFALIGKVAIVMGGGRGIGKGIALCFADAGADVVVAARTTSEIQATAAEIQAKGRKALAVPTDIRDNQQISHLVSRTLKDFGRIDILVNVPSGHYRGPFLEMQESDWEELEKTTLKSLFFLCTQVGKVMLQQKKGTIINISAGYGVHPRAGRAAFGAFKAGVNSLTQALAQEWGPYGVRVNAIAPGWIETPLSMQRYLAQPQLLDKSTQEIPLRRRGKPEDIGWAAVYLASEAASYVSGEILRVHGGALYPP